MPSVLPNKRLQRIAEAKRADIVLWKEGVSLERDSKKNIHQLLCLIATDRWRLAYAFRAQANKLISGRSQNRSGISRFYYSMYHSMRACVFIATGGDDHEAHSELLKNIPADFDPTTDWQRKLKDARLLRNRADYEAYPKSDKSWEKRAAQIKIDADLLLKISRAYLITKGCSL